MDQCDRGMSSDLVGWILEITQLLCGDLQCFSTGCWQSVGSCRWVTGIFSRILCFCLSHHKAAAARQPRVKAWVSRLQNESYAEAKQMVMRWSFFGMVLCNFWCALLLFLNADVNCLPGSAASGRSSCNNTAVTGLWRVYDLVPAVKWGGLLKATWVKPDYMITMCVYKLTFCSLNVCMWYLLLSFVSPTHLKGHFHSHILFTLHYW